jgi:Spy/CpxP family protein refolding chaperone
MRKRWTGVGLAVLATALLTGSAFAQGRGVGGRGMILRMPEVQAELKLTDEQKTKISEMLGQLGGGRRGQGGQSRDLSREEREKQLAERRANEEKQIQAILNEDQLKRYHQLQLQRQGLLALRDAPVRDALKLTDDQRSKVDGILKEQADETQKALESAGGGRRGRGGAARAQLAEIRKKTEEKLEAVLTDDQKKQWKEMLGPAFKFPEVAPARPASDAA